MSDKPNFVNRVNCLEKSKTIAFYSKYNDQRITAADTLRSGQALARPEGTLSSVTLLALQEGAPTLTPLRGSATDNVV